MDAVFPIAQREGDAYHTLSDFTKLFDQAKSGRYLIGQGYGWHSGVHLTSKMLPWGKGLRPIQAMLDGKIVAFRIHSDYQVATYQDQEFKYSNNFVLIEHEAVNPEDSEDVFKFHTLYMHLAPPSDIGANSSITTRYRLQEARNVRTFKHSDVPTNSGEKKQSMSKGTLLEYLYAEEKETHPYQIGKNTYKMIKCRVVENGESPNGGEQAMLNKIVWFASGLNSDFDILEDSSAVLSEPVSEPRWMSDNAAMIRDGSVVSLHTTLFSGGIKVSAGEDIGYMGLQEYSNDAIGTKKDDNRVHIEMFSFEEPPEFFKKQISPKNAEENPLVILDGTDSSGAVDMSNSFIQQLLESVTEDQVTDFSSFTARDAKVYLDGKRKHFERFIVKHPTDWHTESSQSLYESIHQTAKEALDIKCSAGFVTEEDYRNSPWRAQVMDSFDLFSQFELERADKFSWMQDLQGDLQLSGDKSLWHYWPFISQVQSGFKFTLEMLQEVYPRVKDSKRDVLQGIVNELNDHMLFYKLDTPLRRTHFFAQLMQETGESLNMAEYTNYRISTLDTSEFNTARSRRYPLDHPKYAGKRYIDVHGIADKKNGKFIKKDGTPPTLDDKRILFNVMYGGRSEMKNGDFLTTDDGWIFRGRGLKQLTGRDNYERFNKWHLQNQSEWPLDVVDFLNTPELILKAKYATRSAAWFWLDIKGPERADKGENGKVVDEITRKVNRYTSKKSYRKRRENFKFLWENKVFN
ncbi:glycoside hydrolase family 19 protein [Vibrio owensii]|uniref:glycoside hydrolase family 19 protein n=1 Tax=Vibrio owensii TaxID=696485 RepID=UPI003749C960